jgi:carbamate kinase
MTTKDALIALGGNAIIAPGQQGTLEEQYANTDKSMAEVVDLLEAGLVDRCVITHGNGPQVGNILLRSETAASVIFPLTVDVCVSDSAGGMGYMIQQCLDNCMRDRRVKRPVTTIITQVIVDADDPAMKDPRKYIGSFMTEEEAMTRSRERGWVVREDPGRGWRRVIASPDPGSIIELEPIRVLYDAGVVVIAAGGGGIPVVKLADGRLHGVAAVIDKDLASGLLATQLHIPTFVIITGTDGIYTDFRKPGQKHYPRLTVSRLLDLQAQGHFPPGSMGPKVEAAIRFIRNGGERVIITEMGRLVAALNGEAGTWILPDSAADRDAV